jgi:hypothetical protein
MLAFYHMDKKITIWYANSRRELKDMKVWQDSHTSHAAAAADVPSPGPRLHSPDLGRCTLRQTFTVTARAILL